MNQKRLDRFEEKGIKLKANNWQKLFKLGITSADKVMAEFENIEKKQSELTSSLRTQILNLIHDAKMVSSDELRVQAFQEENKLEDEWWEEHKEIRYGQDIRLEKLKAEESATSSEQKS